METMKKTTQTPNQGEISDPTHLERCSFHRVKHPKAASHPTSVPPSVTEAKMSGVALVLSPTKNGDLARIMIQMKMDFKSIFALALFPVSSFGNNHER
jgi:hypothetical protein